MTSPHPGVKYVLESGNAANADSGVSERVGRVAKRIPVSMGILRFGTSLSFPQWSAPLPGITLPESSLCEEG